MNKTYDFLEFHKNADEIVYVEKTGLPYKAIYIYNNIIGGQRTYPAEYYYEDGY
jgi:hypothetical protein